MAARLSLFAAAGAAASALLASSALAPANATLQIAISAGAATLFCADNQACDTNPAVGTLQLADQTIGGIDIHGSIQQSSTGTGGSLITASSLSLVNNSGASVPIDVTVGANGFLGPASTFATTGSGTFTNAIGSSIAYSYFDDPANAQGASSAGDTPGDLIDSFSASITTALQSISHNNSGSLVHPDGGLFSMTLDASGTLTNGGSFLNRGQAESKNHLAPEPYALGVFALPAIWLALLARRRRNWE